MMNWYLNHRYIAILLISMFFSFFLHAQLQDALDELKIKLDNLTARLQGEPIVPPLVPPEKPVKPPEKPDIVPPEEEPVIPPKKPDETKTIIDKIEMPLLKTVYQQLNNLLNINWEQEEKSISYGGHNNRNEYLKTLIDTYIVLQKVIKVEKLQALVNGKFDEISVDELGAFDVLLDNKDTAIKDFELIQELLREKADPKQAILSTISVTDLPKDILDQIKQVIENGEPKILEDIILWIYRVNSNVIQNLTKLTEKVIQNARTYLKQQEKEKIIKQITVPSLKTVYQQLNNLLNINWEQEEKSISYGGSENKDTLFKQIFDQYVVLSQNVNDFKKLAEKQFQEFDEANLNELEKIANKSEDYIKSFEFIQNLLEENAQKQSMFKKIVVKDLSVGNKTRLQHNLKGVKEIDQENITLYDIFLALNLIVSNSAREQLTRGAQNIKGAQEYLRKQQEKEKEKEKKIPEVNLNTRLVRITQFTASPLIQKKLLVDQVQDDIDREWSEIKEVKFVPDDILTRYIQLNTILGKPQQAKLILMEAGYRESDIIFTSFFKDYQALQQAAQDGKILSEASDLQEDVKVQFLEWLEDKSVDTWLVLNELIALKVGITEEKGKKFETVQIKNLPEGYELSSYKDFLSAIFKESENLKRSIETAREKNGLFASIYSSGVPKDMSNILSNILSGLDNFAEVCLKKTLIDRVNEFFAINWSLEENKRELKWVTPGKYMAMVINPFSYSPATRAFAGMINMESILENAIQNLGKAVKKKYLEFVNWFNKYKLPCNEQLNKAKDGINKGLRQLGNQLEQIKIVPMEGTQKLQETTVADYFRNRLLSKLAKLSYSE